MKQITSGQEYRKCIHCKRAYRCWKCTKRKYCSEKCMYTHPAWIKKQRSQTHSDKTKLLIGRQSKLRNSGPGNPRYKTGIHYIRALIKEHANGICSDCHKGFKNVIGFLDIHHIDKDWTNNVASNLVAVCPNCHRIRHLKDKNIL